jgi:phage recombination protein Bet
VLMPQPTVIRGRRERQLTDAEIELLKRTVAKGTSNDEFALFLWVCRKHKVDPVIGQIHCAMFPVKNHHKEKKIGAGGAEIEIWVPGEQMVIMMGINGYRSTAARNHKDFGGCDEATYTFFKEERRTPAGKLIPETATIRMWKKGLEHPIVTTVYWEEFAPHNLGEDRAKFWNIMPKHKLAIVAESHALRKGYPDLADIYTDEEMDQQLQDYADGRKIIEADGRTPSGAPAGVRGVNTWRDQQSTIDAEVEKQKRGETPSTVEEMRGSSPANGNADRIGPQGQPGASTSEPVKGPPTAGTTTAPNPTTTSPKAGGVGPAGGGSAQSSSPAGGFLGKIQVDWADKNSPIVRGDIGDVLEPLKKHCKMTWSGDWWHVLPSDVQTIREMCAAYNYQFSEVFPGTQKGSAVPPPKKKAETKDLGTFEVVTGVMDRVTTGMTSKNAPTRQVQIQKKWYTCYRNTIFNFLDKGLGKNSALYIDARKNIVGIKRIGLREFMEDGLTPIVRTEEDRGGNLFEK